MTAPWYEPGYQSTALTFRVHYTSVAMTNLHPEAIFDCAFPIECLEEPLFVSRRSLNCYGIRQCGCIVDIHTLEISIWQASQSVRIMKRKLNDYRVHSKQPYRNERSNEK